MKKILIGISSPNNGTSRSAIATLVEEFNVEHISMRQPLINMIATLTNMEPVHQEFSCSPQAVVEGLGISIAELEARLAFNLRTIKSNFFITRCAESIAISNSGFNGQLFNGHIISGINTELEAQWLRDHGGVMVHLYNYEDQSQFHALHEIDGDLICIIDTNTRSQQLTATIADIKAVLSQQKQAA